MSAAVKASLPLASDLSLHWLGRGGTVDIEDDAQRDLASTGPWVGKWVTAKMDDECASAARA